jgi:hypothetical protein
MRTHWNDQTLLQPYELIEAVELTSAQTSITFSGLDDRDHKVYRLWIGLRNNSSSARELFLYVNGDTTNSNYRAMYLAVFGTATTVDQQQAPELGWVTGNGTAQFDVHVQMAAGRFSYQSFSSAHLNDPIEIQDMQGFRWSTISHIESLTVQISTSNGMAAGTRAYLFGGSEV